MRVNPLIGLGLVHAKELSLRHLQVHRLEVDQNKPTVSLGVTCAVVDTYGCDDGRIGPTRCAIIDAGLDGRGRPCRTCRTPPAAARSGRNALAAGLRPGSTSTMSATLTRMSGTLIPVRIRKLTLPPLRCWGNPF